MMTIASSPDMIFDHAGFIVRDLPKVATSIVKSLPITAKTKRFDDAVLGVSVQFLRDAKGIVLELVAPYGENSPVAKIAASRVGTINQLAYRVVDLEAGAAHLRSNRAVPTGAPKPSIAFGGALVQFFYLPDHFIIELIEAPDFTHSFEEIRLLAD